MKKMKSALIVTALVTALGISTAFAATTGTADYDQNPHKMRDKVQQYFNSQKNADGTKCPYGFNKQGKYGQHKKQGMNLRQESGIKSLAELTGRDAASIREEIKTNRKPLREIAKDAGVYDQFQAKRLELMKERLDKKVADGKITREKADGILAAVKEGKRPQGAKAGKHHMMKQGKFGGMQERNIAILAELTGRDAASIREEIKTNRKPLREIAKDAGVYDQFQAKRLELVKERLDKAVADGKMSQEKADGILAAIKEGKKPQMQHKGMHKQMKNASCRNGS
ncbi:MAG: hypothetical protein GX084_03995 [Acholeplasmataceae bacterium]|nr:hypothetical protein [Acholeplasmataceae bacterium]